MMFRFFIVTIALAQTKCRASSNTTLVVNKNSTLPESGNQTTTTAVSTTTTTITRNRCRLRNHPATTTISVISSAGATTEFRGASGVTTTLPVITSTVTPAVRAPTITAVIKPAPSVVKPTVVPPPKPVPSTIAKLPASNPAPPPPPPVQAQYPTTAPGLPPNFQSCVDLHNKARSELGLAPLTANSTLSASAEAYAQVLKQKYGSGPLTLVHSKGLYGNVGENLYANSGTVTCTGAMEGWVTEEKPKYVVGTKIGDGDFEAYGHYTQIMYKSVTQVGCSSESGRYYVCHYDKIQITGTLPF